MKKTEIYCDECEAELTWTTNCIDYRIRLICEPIPSQGGAVTAMHIAPDFDRDLHFCNRYCLHTWIGKCVRI